MRVASPGGRQIGVTTFDDHDQRRFAAMSWDCNPIHMDATAARRLLTGHRIVHGVHLLLQAIERWQNDDDARPSSIAGSFDHPVSVGEVVTFTQRRKDEHRFVIDAAVNGLSCARTVITTRPRAVSKAPPPEARPDIRHLDRLAAPLDDAPECHVGKCYAITPGTADWSADFPIVNRYFGAEVTSSIAALSYFTGMICPGLHSVLSSVTVELSDVPSADHSLVFTVQKYDPRFRLFDIAFDGPIHGTLQAFLRKPPSVQPTLAQISEHVGPAEFRGTSSLVIGGSRGLGELTAKVLAAGGGDVVITYAAGEDDARRVCDEIQSRGGCSCEAVKLDVMTDTFESAGVDRDRLDAVFFFATPKIFKKSATVFDPERFQEFSGFYVRTLYDLCAYLEGRAAPKPVRVFFPSSVAIAERPKGLAEYAMAKAAAEVLIDDINRSFKKVTVLSARLPRLDTDQTASMISVPTSSNIETLLPLIRSLYA